MFIICFSSLFANGLFCLKVSYPIMSRAVSCALISLFSISLDIFFRISCFSSPLCFASPTEDGRYPKSQGGATDHLVPFPRSPALATRYNQGPAVPMDPYQYPGPPPAPYRFHTAYLPAISTAFLALLASRLLMLFSEALAPLPTTLPPFSRSHQLVSGTAETQHPPHLSLKSPPGISPGVATPPVLSSTHPSSSNAVIISEYRHSSSSTFSTNRDVIPTAQDSSAEELRSQGKECLPDKRLDELSTATPSTGWMRYGTPAHESPPSRPPTLATRYSRDSAVPMNSCHHPYPSPMLSGFRAVCLPAIDAVFRDPFIPQSLDDGISDSLPTLPPLSRLHPPALGTAEIPHPPQTCSLASPLDPSRDAASSPVLSSDYPSFPSIVITSASLLPNSSMFLTDCDTSPMVWEPVAKSQHRSRPVSLSLRLCTSSFPIPLSTHCFGCFSPSDFSHVLPHVPLTLSLTNFGTVEPWLRENEQLVDESSDEPAPSRSTIAPGLAICHSRGSMIPKMTPGDLPILSDPRSPSPKSPIAVVRTYQFSRNRGRSESAGSSGTHPLCLSDSKVLNILDIAPLPTFAIAPAQQDSFTQSCGLPYFQWPLVSGFSMFLICFFSPFVNGLTCLVVSHLVVHQAIRVVTLYISLVFLILRNFLEFLGRFRHLLYLSAPPFVLTFSTCSGQYPKSRGRAISHLGPAPKSLGLATTCCDQGSTTPTVAPEVPLRIGMLLVPHLHHPRHCLDPPPTLSGSRATRTPLFGAMLWSLLVTLSFSLFRQRDLGPSPVDIMPFITDISTRVRNYQDRLPPCSNLPVRSDPESLSPESPVTNVGTYRFPQNRDRSGPAESPGTRPLCPDNTDILNVRDVAPLPTFATAPTWRVPIAQISLTRSRGIPCSRRSPVSILLLLVTHLFSHLASGSPCLASSGSLVSQIVFGTMFFAFLVSLVSRIVPLCDLPVLSHDSNVSLVDRVSLYFLFLFFSDFPENFFFFFFSRLSCSSCSSFCLAFPTVGGRYLKPRGGVTGRFVPLPKSPVQQPASLPHHTRPPVPPLAIGPEQSRQSEPLIVMKGCENDTGPALVVAKPRLTERFCHGHVGPEISNHFTGVSRRFPNEVVPSRNHSNHTEHPLPRMMTNSLEYTNTLLLEDQLPDGRDRPQYPNHGSILPNRGRPPHFLQKLRYGPLVDDRFLST